MRANQVLTNLLARAKSNFMSSRSDQNKVLRKEFLEKKWSRYPTSSAPRAADGDQTWINARVILVSESEIEVRTSRYQVLTLENLTSCEEMSVEWNRLLRAGDWICYFEKSGKIDIRLLAPNVSESDKVSNISSKKMQTLQKWSYFLQCVRLFFIEREFLEIQTPSLVACPGTEPFLDVFSTELKIGSHRQKLYLPTSPELHLKKALAQGLPKIFELKPCFRNGEMSDRHSPEFLMLEWYRAFSDLSQIQSDVRDLILFLAEKLEVNAPSSFSLETVSQSFKRILGYELSPFTTREQLVALSNELDLRVRNDDTWDDLFSQIMVEKIEPNLSTEGLFLSDYPPSQAALARISTEGWGERFEFYWKGYELANAFHELNDPVEQRARSLEDLEKKKSLGKEVVDLDEAFFKALESGMPPSSGIALGLDRLFMCLMSIEDIREISLFPY